MQYGGHARHARADPLPDRDSVAAASGSADRQRQARLQENRIRGAWDRAGDPGFPDRTLERVPGPPQARLRAIAFQPASCDTPARALPKGAASGAPTLSGGGWCAATQTEVASAREEAALVTLPFEVPTPHACFLLR